MTGTLYGVGVGPGDPELLTLKAIRVLHDAPVIAYPAPLEGESLARSHPQRRPGAFATISSSGGENLIRN